MLMFNFCCKYLNLKMFALKSNHYKNGLEIKTTVIKTIEDVLGISKAEIPGDFL